MLPQKGIKKYPLNAKLKVCFNTTNIKSRDDCIILGNTTTCYQSTSKAQLANSNINIGMDQHQIMANPKDETISKELGRSNRSRSKLSTIQIDTTHTSQKEE